MTQLTGKTRLTRRQFYTICALLFAFLCNQLSFQGGRLLAFWRYHYDFTLPLDLQVPFLPWTIVIYFGAFVFWAVSLFFCSLQEREESDRLFSADLLSKIVSFLFFVILPTTNVRPVVAGSGFFDYGMRFLYWIDRADNLFPSIHCSMSWLCWVWMRGKKHIPLGWRTFSMLFAIAVCISTLTTRQHVLIDAAGGIVLAEACYAVAGNVRVRGVYTRFMDKLLGTLAAQRNQTSRQQKKMSTKV